MVAAVVAGGCVRGLTSIEASDPVETMLPAFRTTNKAPMPQPKRSSGDTRLSEHVSTVAMGV